MWQQLKLASELESDLRNNDNWARKWLVDFNAVKTQLVLFEQSNSSNDIDLKMDGLFLKKSHILKYLDCLSLLNYTGGLILSLLLEVSPRKLEPRCVL